MKKSSKDKIGIAALVVVIAAVVGAGVYLYQRQNDDEE